MFLDCGNIDRMPVSFLRRDDAHIVNIDHHHDNTNFGTANLVVDGASCTAEIIWDLASDLGVEITPTIADALYVGLVTDTGKFQYENTTPDVAPMAAELLEHGVDVHDDLPPAVRERARSPSCSCWPACWSRIERYDDGRLTISFIKRSDYEETGADENDFEGIVDHMRALEGTVVAALVREQLKEGREGVRKVSLRASADEVDVSVIARKRGRRRPPPGGRLLHRAAAGRAGRVPARGDRGPALDPMAVAATGVLLVASRAGATSHDIVAQVRRSDRRGAAPRSGHAGTLDPFATGPAAGAGRPARRGLQRYFMALPKAYRARARLGAVSDTGDPTGADRADRGQRATRRRVRGGAARRSRARSSSACRGYSAVKVGGERLYRKARRGEDGRDAGAHGARSTRCELAGFDEHAQEAELEVECSSGTYVRQLVADLGELLGAGAYCEALERTRDRPLRARPARRTTASG